MALISRKAAVRAGLLAGAVIAWSPAHSQTQRDRDERLRRLEIQLEQQAMLIAQQETRLAQQEDLLAELRMEGDRDVLAARARGLEPQTDVPAPQIQVQPIQAQAQPSAALPATPVGQAPAEQRVVESEVRAVPEGQGVLTPRGTLVIDSSLEYTRSSQNRLVFRGFELIPGIQIGLIEATDADRDTLVSTIAARFGILNNLEAEIRVPALHRYDRIEVAQQRDQGIVREIALNGNGLGDVELALRYQLNRPVGQRPIWIGSLRVKSDTGKGPFDIGYDEFGVANGLATGSGFWGVAPGVNFLLPSDPVVIYGGGSYLFHLKRNVDRLVGEVPIGEVDPGDALNANIGFGFALNPRFSFSLGYRHSYIFKTRTEIDDSVQFSKELQVGSLNFGMSYRLSERDTVNLGFEFGVTEDAPDVSITLRAPFEIRF